MSARSPAMRARRASSVGLMISTDEALSDEPRTGGADSVANKRATGRLKDLADAERLAHQGRRRRKGSTQR